jgi:hypothetical protein
VPWHRKRRLGAGPSPGVVRTGRVRPTKLPVTLVTSPILHNRPTDLDPDQCLILLQEKGETVRCR